MKTIGLGLSVALGSAGLLLSFDAPRPHERAYSAPSPRSSSQRILTQGESISTLRAAPLGLVEYCYAPGTPDDVVAKHPYPGPAKEGIGPEFNVTSRWSGSTGTPRALTWSFIPDGVAVDGQTNEIFSRMDTLFAAQGGRSTWIAQFQACFDRWSALAGVSYTRIKYNGNDWDDGAVFGSGGSSTRGDIRISMIIQDGALSVLAYNYYPSNGDMVLDRDENWASSSGSYLFLRNVLMHEHGHGLGLKHVCPLSGTKLMEPRLALGFDGPQHDDLRAAHQLYGDRYELNDTAATATPLGTLALAATFNLGPVPAPAISNGSLLSIEADGRQDFYRVDIPASTGIDVTVTPLGLSYDSSTQNADGTCNSGNVINSLTMADLSFDVLASNGSTVLQSVHATSAGVAEQTQGLILPSAGTYYIKVYESGTPLQPQLYTLNVANPDCNQDGISDAIAIQNGINPDCDGDHIPDGCELSPSTDTNQNQLLDVCERRHGDFDLDGDVDVVDFSLLQQCLTFNNIACLKADLNRDGTVNDSDIAIFVGCLSGPDIPYAMSCN